MKKLSLILFSILALLMLISLITLNTMKQNLSKTYQIKEASKVGSYEQATGESTRLPASRKTVTRASSESKEGKEPEFDLGDIPEERPNKLDTETRETQDLSLDKGASSERVLSTQPSADELKGLKTKGIIIY